MLLNGKLQTLSDCHFPEESGFYLDSVITCNVGDIHGWLVSRIRFEI